MNPKQAHDLVGSPLPRSNSKPGYQAAPREPKRKAKVRGETRDGLIESAWPGKASRNGWNGRTDWY